MRIGTQRQYEAYQLQILNAQRRYTEAQERVTTGRRFTSASEDLIAAGTVLSARAAQRQVEALDRNLRVASDYLGTSETAVSEAVTLLRRASVLAVQGANSTVEPLAREAMANEVAEIQRRLVEMANSRGTQGQFVFAGQANGTRPFTATPPTLTFNGDTDPIRVETRPGEMTRVDTPSSDFWTGAYADLENLRTSLLSGNPNLIGGRDVAAIQARSDGALRLQGDIGARLQTVTALKSDNARRIDEFTERISDAQDIDLAQAITEMQLAQTAYQASLQVTARASDLSLLDFLR